MKFSTVTYFAIAFVMTFATSFGLAEDVRNLRGLDAVPAEEPPRTDLSLLSKDEIRQMEIEGLEDYHQAQDEFDAGNADRELYPDITCYTTLCRGIARGYCYRYRPQCYPL